MFDPMLLCLYLARTALVQPQVSATLSTKIALGIVTLIQPKSKKNKSSYNGEESTLRWSGGVDFVLGYTEPIASSTPKSTRRDNKWIPQDESWIEMKSSISPIMDDFSRELEE